MDEFIRRPKFYFLITGCWPIKKSKWSWIYHLYSFLTTYTISYLFLASLAIEMYTHAGNLIEITEVIFVIMTHLTFLIKLLCFNLKRNKFLKLVNELKNTAFSSYYTEQEIYITNWSNYANFYIKNYYRMCLTCLGFFAIPPLIPGLTNNALPFRAWFPFRINTQFKLTVAYLFQVISVLILVTINIHLDILPCAFMNIGCAQIEILKDSLANVVKRAERHTKQETVINNKSIKMEICREIGDNYVEMLTKDLDDEVQRKLRMCVVHHMKIISFFHLIQDIFGYAMFSQFVLIVASLCFSGLQLAMIPSNSMKFYTDISYLVSSIIQISIYCWNGNHVINQSSSIGNSCYNAEWYRCSTKVRKYIFLIMERVKRPIQLKAGKFFTISLLTLTSILRSSYSYLAVLREVYGE